VRAPQWGACNALCELRRLCWHTRHCCCGAQLNNPFGCCVLPQAASSPLLCAFHSLLRLLCPPGLTAWGLPAATGHSAGGPGRGVASVLAGIERRLRVMAREKVPEARGHVRAIIGQPFFVPLYTLFLVYGGVFRLSFGPKVSTKVPPSTVTVSVTVTVIVCPLLPGRVGRPVWLNGAPPVCRPPFFFFFWAAIYDRARTLRWRATSSRTTQRPTLRYAKRPTPGRVKNES